MQTFISHIAWNSEVWMQVLSAAKNNMVALPGLLFNSTQIPVCLWFLGNNKSADARAGTLDRRRPTDAGLAARLSTMENKS